MNPLIVAQFFIRRISTTQTLACTEDFCFICGRCTDHWGEHSDKQILDYWSKRPALHFPPF